MRMECFPASFPFIFSKWLLGGDRKSRSQVASSINACHQPGQGLVHGRTRSQIQKVLGRTDPFTPAMAADAPQDFVREGSHVNPARIIYLVLQGAGEQSPYSQFYRPLDELIQIEIVLFRRDKGMSVQLWAYTHIK